MFAFHKCNLLLIGQKQDNDWLYKAILSILLNLNKMITDVFLSRKQIQVINVKDKCNTYYYHLLQIALSAYAMSAITKYLYGVVIGQ